MVVRLRGNRENVSRNNCIVRRFVTSGPYLTIRAVLWRAPLRDPQLNALTALCRGLRASVQPTSDIDMTATTRRKKS